MSNCIGGTSSVVLKRECFARVGLFDEDLPSFQDYDLWIRIAREFQFDYIRDSLLKYYVHTHKISTNLDGIARGLEKVLVKYGESKAFRRQCSYRYLLLGRNFCLQGNLKKGRKAFIKAITLYPLEIRHYFNYFLSLLGEKSFQQFKWSK